MMQKDINLLKAQLLGLLKKQAFRKGGFLLSSGKISPFYIDGRCITLSAQGAYLSAVIILELLKGQDVEAVGGPTLGADPIAGAIAAVSFIENRPMKTFLIRKNTKEHGTKRRIEGPSLKANSRLILIDDVATSGKSFVESLEVLRAEGFKVDTAICIVDRNEGAKELLSQNACALSSIFTPRDFGI